MPPTNQHLKGGGKRLSFCDGADDGSEKLAVRRNILAKWDGCASDCIDTVPNGKDIC